MQNKPSAATARPAAATEKFGDVGGDAAVEVEQASEPQERKTRRKLLQVPGGSAPRELADLARLSQSLRTKTSPPLALT